MTEEDAEEEIKQWEEELKKLEDKDTSYGSPTAATKENLFKFFNKILTRKDTTRVANLTRQEVGLSEVSVRGWKRIAHYADAENLDTVAEYMRGQSEIITATSMSIKGFWSQLFVTNIRKESKSKDKSSEKKKWFSKPPEGGE